MGVQSKKKTFSFSLTEDEGRGVLALAKAAGFEDRNEYLLALLEAAAFLDLRVELDSASQRILRPGPKSGLYPVGAEESGGAHEMAKAVAAEVVRLLYPETGDSGRAAAEARSSLPTADEIIARGVAKERSVKPGGAGKVPASAKPYPKR